MCVHGHAGTFPVIDCMRDLVFAHACLCGCAGTCLVVRQMDDFVLTHACVGAQPLACTLDAHQVRRLCVRP